MDAIKETVRTFILTNFLAGESAGNLRDDTPLQSSGILDSLAVLTLVSFLQKQFAVELDVYDTSVERFDRIDHIAATITRKRAPIV
jgi:acyl carrier protein